MIKILVGLHALLKIQNLIYRIINALSIDISLGAVVVAYFFCVVFGVVPEWSSLLVLGLCVWIIYTTDHLLDARKMKVKASTFRHQFHQDNFKFLFSATIVMGIVAAILSFFFLNPIGFSFGLVLSGVAIVYLLCQRFLFYLKEIIGAILYTIGILIPTVGQANFILSTPKLFLTLQFFLVVVMNLILFSNFDKKNDEFNRQLSFAIRFGTSTTNRLVWVIFLFAVGTAMLNIFSMTEYAIPSIIILAMTFLLASIQFFPSYFSQHDRFRYIGDGIFFLPLLYWFFQ